MAFSTMASVATALSIIGTHQFPALYGLNLRKNLPWYFLHFFFNLVIFLLIIFFSKAYPYIIDLSLFGAQPSLEPMLTYY